MGLNVVKQLLAKCFVPLSVISEVFSLEKVGSPHI